MTLVKQHAVFLGTLICGLTITVSATPRFDARMDFSYGGSDAQCAILEDLNHDSTDDIAIASVSLEIVSIMHGQPNGTFLLAETIPVGIYPKNLQTGDLDNDGSIDLVVVNRLSNNISILLNDGTGSFNPLTPLDVGTRPVAAVLADFNDNDTLDLAVAHESSSDLLIFSGNGDGTFEQTANYTLGNYQMQLHAADFDQNGCTDLAVMLSVDQEIVILFGETGGGFTPAPPIPTDVVSLELQVQILDQDNLSDMIVTSAYDNTVLIYQNLGNGQFAQPQTMDLDYNPLSTMVADIDSDQDQDMIICNHEGNAIYTYINNQSTYVEGDTFAIPFSPNLSIASDLNGDLENDIVVLSSSTDQVSVLLATTPGSFQLSQTYPVGGNASMIFASDLNHDSHLDLLTLNWNSGTVSTLLNQSDGTFPLPGNQSILINAWKIIAHDISGDNHPDLIALGGLNRDIVRLISLGSGEFTNAIAFPMPASIEVGCAGDMDGDQMADLVLGGEKLIIAFNEGEGAFLESVTYHDFNNCQELKLIDLNRDQHLDVITALDYRYLNILYNDSAGGLQQPQLIWEFPSSNQQVKIRNIELAHLNPDSLLDMIVTVDDNFNFGQTAVFLQDNGTFGIPTMIEFIALPQELAVGDFDGDQDNDIALTCWDDDFTPVQLYRNNGTGEFQSAAYWVKQGEMRDLNFSDVDLDDDLDLVAIDYLGNALVVWENDGLGNFNQQWMFGVQQYPAGMVCCDLNRDNYVDVAAVHGLSPTLTLLWNDNVSWVKPNPNHPNQQKVISLPTQYQLLPPYPNPFNSQVTIPYIMSTSGSIDINIYNILGQRVYNTHQSHINPGNYKITWQAKDQRGIDVASGVYTIRIQSGKETSINRHDAPQIKNVILMK